jgi:hypothetical protein
MARKDWYFAEMKITAAYRSSPISHARVPGVCRDTNGDTVDGQRDYAAQSGSKALFRASYAANLEKNAGVQDC